MALYLYHSLLRHLPYGPVKCFCITFILMTFFTQVEPVPAYQATTQNDSRTSNQSIPVIETPQGGAKTPITSDKTEPATDKIKRAEWAQIFINGFIALVILWQAWTYHQQRKLMQRQLDAIDRQAGTMQGQLTAMQESLAETQKMVVQNERAVKASETQAIASQISAKAAERNLEIAQQAYIASARAYVGIREIKIGSLLVGQIPTLYATWYNGGNTPAFRFRAIPYLVFGVEPERRSYIIDDDWSDSRANFLPTGIQQTISYPQAETGFKPITKEMLAELEQGNKRLYAMILARFVDFTGQERHFETSYIYDPYEEIFTQL